MKKIMTPDVFEPLYEEQTGVLAAYSHRAFAEAYAEYYHRERVKEVLSDERMEKALITLSKTQPHIDLLTRLSQKVFQNGIQKGAEWAREELLKLNN